MPPVFVSGGSQVLAQAEPSLSEAASWLRDYLRTDTTNPPGNEHRGAALLARILRDEGINYRLLVTPEGRTSLYARLPATVETQEQGGASEDASGDASGDALVLMHHIDVVPASDDWDHEPFSGDVVDGYLWGRGAIDVKSLGIAQLAAMVELARSDAPRHRDVVLLAVADEENGGGRGSGWLVEHHPELFEGVGAILNEGGANRFVGGRVLWWGIEVAQKRPLWIRVSASGRGGHAAGLNPFSATHKLVAALGRLLEMPPEYRVTPGVRLYMKAVAPLHGDRLRPLMEDIDSVIGPEGAKKRLMPGMIGLFMDTVQITRLEAGDRINTIVPEAWAEVDIRLLPDIESEVFLQRVKDVLGDDVDVEVLVTSPPALHAPVDSRAYQTLEEVFAREGDVVPAFISGFTDSRYFRARGIPTYGVSPFALTGEELRGIHARNERISIQAFDDGVERMTAILRAYVRPEKDEEN
ncbi:MAG: M20/M25/M40 family metallo-hydrolase [Acidobacteriota bacterium]